MNKNKLKQLLESSGRYQVQAEFSRKKAREQFRAKESKECNDLRLIIDALVASLVTIMTTPVEKVSEAISYQITCCASFTRAHFVINDLLMRGDVPEAATLIRKQVEVSARAVELDTQPLSKLLKKTPKVSALFRNGEGQMYGALSTAAHFGEPEMAQLLSVADDPLRGVACVSVYPSYNNHVHTCFEMQYVAAVYFLGWIIGKLRDWYPSKDFTLMQELFFVALHEADTAGVIKLPTEADHVAKRS